MATSCYSTQNVQSSIGCDNTTFNSHCHRSFCQRLIHFIRCFFTRTTVNASKIRENSKSRKFFLKYWIFFIWNARNPWEREIIWPRRQLIDDNKWIHRLDRAILGKARWNVIDGLAECWTSLFHFVAVERRYVLGEYHRNNLKKYQSSAMASKFFGNYSCNFAELNLIQFRFAVKMNNFGDNSKICKWVGQISCNVEPSCSSDWFVRFDETHTLSGTRN